MGGATLSLLPSSVHCKCSKQKAAKVFRSQRNNHISQSEQATSSPLPVFSLRSDLLGLVLVVSVVALVRRAVQQAMNERL